jgi:hypothetical protein
MTKFKTILIGAIVFAGVAISLVIQHQAQAKLQQQDEVVRAQDNQLAELAAEHQRLSNLVAQAQSSPVDGQAGELRRLRREADQLRKQTNDLGKQLAQNRRSPASKTASKEPPHPPEYYEQLHQIAGGKTKDARTLGMAFNEYASDHQGQLPSSFDQIDSYLRKEGQSLTGTNEFEIVYRGSPRQSKVPQGEIIVFRERQAWLAPSGKWAKVYGMANGVAQIVESDDNFKGWEADHITALPPGAR